MIRCGVHPGRLCAPLVLRGAETPTLAIALLGRQTDVVTFAGRDDPSTGFETVSLAGLAATRIGDPALRRALARLGAAAETTPPPQARERTIRWQPRDPLPGTGAAAPASAADEPAPRVGRPPLSSVVGAPPVPRAAAATIRSAIRTQSADSATRRNIELPGTLLSRRRLAAMAGWIEAPAGDTPPRASGTPPSRRDAPSAPPEPKATDLQAEPRHAVTSPGRNPAPRPPTPGSSQPKELPPGNTLADLMTHWERATQPSGQADHPDAGPHPVGFGGAADPIAATPHASTGRTGSAPGTVTTNGDHASAATPGAIDAPDLAAEALLLEMLERALRSEARRHGVQLEGGLL